MNIRIISVLIFCLLCNIFSPDTAGKKIFIGDSYDRSPLPAAALFNKDGGLIGISDNEGNFDHPDLGSYPVRITYLGYKDKILLHPADTVLLVSTTFNLPEVTVDQNKTGVRLICFVKESLSFTTDSDTTLISSDYLVDYIVPLQKKVKGFKAHKSPRILDTRRKIIRTHSELSEESLKYLEMLSPVNFSSLQAGKLPYPAVLNESENVSADLTTTKNKSVHFKRRGETLALFMDALEGSKDNKISPGFFKLLGLTFDFTRFDLSNTYNFNPAGIDQIFDKTGTSIAVNMNLRGKVLKRMLKSSSDIKCEMLVEIIPLDYQLITTEESAELLKDPGDLKISQYKLTPWGR